MIKLLSRLSIGTIYEAYNSIKTSVRRQAYTENFKVR